MQYETRERWEAAWLLSQGQKLIDASLKGNSKLVSFVFEDSDKKIDDLLLAFQNDTKLQGFLQGFEQITRMIRRESDRNAADRN